MLRKSRTSSGSPSHDSRRTTRCGPPSSSRSRNALLARPPASSVRTARPRARRFPDRAGVEVRSPGARLALSCATTTRSNNRCAFVAGPGISACQRLPQRGGQRGCELEIADDRRRRRQHQVVRLDHRQLSCAVGDADAHAAIVVFDAFDVELQRDLQPFPCGERLRRVDRCRP